MIKHYVNETGTSFILDCGILIGSVTEQCIKWKKPSGVTGSWAADLYDSYSDLASATGTYLLSHTLEYADLSESGDWKFQAFVAAIDGTWHGETTELNILGLFE